MRRWTLLLLGALVTGPLWAEIDLGVGISPPMLSADELQAEAEANNNRTSPLGNSIVSFHAGWAFSWLFLATGDAYVLPPAMVRKMTTFVTNDGYLKDGIYRPGFLMLGDAGLRLKVGPFGAMTELGLNNLYIYREQELQKDVKPDSFGVNVRVGAFWRFSRELQLSLTGMAVFPNFEAVTQLAHNLMSSDSFVRNETAQAFFSTLYPTVGLSFVLDETGGTK